MTRYFLLTAASALIVSASTGLAADIRESAELATAFAEAGITGTFVMLDPDGGILRAHDADRAGKRFIPGSTFKIANSLIGLESGSVKNVDEVLPYGGKPQPFPAWEHDMSLRDAIKISNVPIYQELARRTGLERMQVGVKNLGYGNETIGDVVDRFWLDGPLEISTIEQVEFLRRVAKGDVPVSKETIAAVQEITLLEKTPAYELHGKTGWVTSVEPHIGWFVGWVERDGQIYPFALNIDGVSEDLISKRVPLAKRCLQILGVL